MAKRNKRNLKLSQLEFQAFDSMIKKLGRLAKAAHESEKAGTPLRHEANVAQVRSHIAKSSKLLNRRDARTAALDAKPSPRKRRKSN